VKKILVKNSIFGLVQGVLNLLLVFWAVPVFIRKLGSESYGVFAIVMVIGNLNTFTNLGLTSALVKFISEQGRTEESNIDIVVNLMMLVGLTLPLVFIILALSRFVLTDILNIPPKIYGEAKWLFLWVVLANFFLLIGQVFKSILDALQKIYITSLQQLIYNLLYWGLILTFLYMGLSLPAIGLAVFMSAFIWLVITIISSLREWGKISFSGVRNNIKDSMRKQLRYGIKIYASGLIGFFYEPLSKILVSNFIGVTQVGFFDIALRLRSQLWGFIAKIFYPLFPFISEQKDKSIVRKYVHDLEQKTFLVVAPVVGIVILLMHPFIQIWIGKDVEIISITAIFIISFHLIGSSTVIPNYQFLMAKDLAQKTIILQLSNVVFNSALFLLTVHFIGYYALIVGNVAAIVSSFSLSLYYQKKFLNSLIFDSFSQVLRLFASLALMLVIGSLVKELLDGHNTLIMLVLPTVLFPMTIFLYKVLGLVRVEDVYRYFGTNNKISKVLANIYST